MAISLASGASGFDGNFSPIIYSKQAQIALRKAAVANAITNNSYFGEIANQGDVVRIQKEPDVTVNALERKTAISVQDLDDSDFQLTIDKANYFAFKMDDIEDQFSHVDFVSMAADRAAYKMADAMDADLLSYMSGYSTAGVVVTTVSGTAQHPTAGNLTGELLTANKLDMSDIGHITTAAAAQPAPRDPDQYPSANDFSSCSIFQHHEAEAPNRECEGAPDPERADCSDDENHPLPPIPNPNAPGIECCAHR
jgi:hypothetical protein